MAFREGAAREIRARLDLAEFVGEYLNLKKSGSEYVGLCPFHAEDTPSFHVSAEKGVFYCFGCQAGGDIFDFVMRKEGLSFPEALQVLAARAGIAVERADNPSRRRWRELLQAATLYYRRNLLGPEGEPGRRYLESRNLSPEVLERFQIGYASAGWDHLSRHMLGKGFLAEELLAVGLVRNRHTGTGVVDLFRDRIVFPIEDALGQVVGFGGRQITAGDGPKYLNTPETEFFQKRRLLYGLFQARTAFRERRRALVVEGYMDVLACHQYGFTEAVAGLGTAFGTEQLAELGRRVEEVYLGFDADRAGGEATRRVLAEGGGINLRVVRWPEGKDPDEFLHRRGAEAMEKLLGEAPAAVDFIIQEALDRYGDVDPIAKGRVAREVLPSLAVLPPVERDEYLRRLSHRLGVSEEALRAEKALKHRLVKKWHNTRNNSENPAGKGDLTEKLLLLLMMGDEAFRRRGAEIRPEQFRTEHWRRLFAALVADPERPPDEVFAGLEDPELRSAAAGLMLDREPLRDGERIWADCLRRLDERRLQELTERWREGQPSREEVAEYQALLRRLKGSRVREGGENGERQGDQGRRAEGADRAGKEPGKPDLRGDHGHPGGCGTLARADRPSV